MRNLKELAEDTLQLSAQMKKGAEHVLQLIQDQQMEIDRVVEAQKRLSASRVLSEAGLVKPGQVHYVESLETSEAEARPPTPLRMGAWVLDYAGTHKHVLIGTIDDVLDKSRDLGGGWVGPYEFTIAVKP